MPGPPPKNDGTRRTKGALPYVLAELPSEGRKGRAPAWPLAGRAPRGWAALWRLPQAVMWEKMHSELAVARYLLLRVDMEDAMAEKKEVKSAVFSEIRQSEDALGLSPKGMQTLRWRVRLDEVEEQRQHKRASNPANRRARLKVVADEA
ncbi:phage terminase small subunit [Corynebacterium sp. H113]|uniref:phage terminase small subunit n=1 Tax=Corynebacterium sp. H113 TaxID=3133419 RepID=UPI003097E19B